MNLLSYCFTISGFILAVYYQWFSFRGLGSNKISIFSYCLTISGFILTVYYQWFSFRGLL